MNGSRVNFGLRRMISRAILRGFPPCKEIVKIISASLDRPLTLKEKLLMKIHLFACKPCVRYLDQSAFLSKAVSKMNEQEKADLFSGALSNEARDRIKSLLRSGMSF